MPGHGAANVTLGIPRLREIVMTASRKPKTPSMTMLIRSDVPEEDIDAFCKKAGRLTLSQVVDKVTVKETLVANGSARTKAFSVELSFYPASEYTAEYGVEPSEILSAFGTKFSLILKKEIQNELRKFDLDMKSQMANLGRGKAVRERTEAGNGEEGEEDGEEPSGRTRGGDDESEVGDGDATATKRQRQSKEQASYEDDEDDEDDENDTAMKDDEIEAAYASDHDSEDEEPTTGPEDLTEQVEIVEQIFLEHFKQARAFSFRDSGCTIDLEVSTLCFKP